MSKTFESIEKDMTTGIMAKLGNINSERSGESFMDFAGYASTKKDNSRSGESFLQFAGF